MSPLLYNIKSHQILGPRTLPWWAVRLGSCSYNSKLPLQSRHQSASTQLSNVRSKTENSKNPLSFNLLQANRRAAGGNHFQQSHHYHPYCTFHKYKAVMDAPTGVFRGSVDRFNGITIESKAEFDANDDFATKLQKSIRYWIEHKYRAIWFKVLTEHSQWIPILTKNGFDFHHAKTGFAVVCRWLPTDEYANIPVYAHTMVGVGGVVINDKNEVLVVSERFTLIPNSWKLPGGYVEPRENLIDAAIREVREETGIDCKFKTVISIRHSHGGSFGCSDIYVVVGLTPQNLELNRCEREIAKIQWMPIDEYLQHPHVHETNRSFVRTFLDYSRRGINFTCQVGLHQVLKKEYCLYYMEPVQPEESGDSNALKD